MLVNNTAEVPKDVPAIIEKYKMPDCLTPAENEKIFGAHRTMEMSKYRPNDNKSKPYQKRRTKGKR